MPASNAEELAAQMNPDDRPIAVRERPQETPPVRNETPVQVSTSTETPMTSDVRKDIVKEDKKMEINEKEREFIATVFKQRIDIVKQLDKSDPSLRHFDKVIATSGGEVMQRFKTGEGITKEDYVLAWSLVLSLIHI